MRLPYFIFMFCALMFFSFSCDNDNTSTLENKDEDSAITDDDAVSDESSTDIDDVSEPEDNDVAEINDDSETPDADNGGELPPPPPDTGSFSLSFNGVINASTDFKSWQGGTGDVTFTDNETESTYTQISIPLMSVGFPLTMVQQGKTVTVWLDKIDLNENHKVFGFNYPGNLEPGDYKMEDTGAAAFYGDVIVQATAGNFEIKCIRSATIIGDLTVISDDGTNIEYSASGNLYDPSIAGAQLPYPVCTD